MRHWFTVIRAAVEELRRGGLRDLASNLEQRAQAESLKIQALGVGAPLVSFENGRVRVVSTKPDRALADQ
jgi:hypothetical protein